MRLRVGLVAAALAAAVAALLVWRSHRDGTLPGTLLESNGRLEMTRIDIAAKYPGRVVAVLVHEGDRVEAGAVLAREDSAEIEAQIEGATQQRAQAQQARARAQAEVDAHRRAQALAELEWNESRRLHAQALVSDVELSRRQLALEAEVARVKAAIAALGEAEAAAGAADAQVRRLAVIRDDLTLRAPVAGRIELRVVEPGAVVAAGAPVVSLLDTRDVYMTVFLPAQAAGQVRLGDEARIVPEGGAVLPAAVTFVAPEAQFTPKYVETRSERERLSFRVRLQVPAAVAEAQEGLLKAGVPGAGYVRLAPDAAWPGSLMPAAAH